MTKVSHDDSQRITDVDTAYDAALAEHEQREALSARLVDLQRQVDQAAAERHQRLVTGEHDDPTADPVHHNPLRQRVSQILHTRHAGQILHEAAVAQLLDEVDAAIKRSRATREGLDRAAIRLATRQIILAVREEFGYTPWLTLSAREVERVLDDCPGVVVQIQDAKNEETGHPVASGDCEQPGCIHESRCVHLVSTAWSDGSHHLAPSWPVTVRIEASA